MTELQLCPVGCQVRFEGIDVCTETPKDEEISLTQRAQEREFCQKNIKCEDVHTEGT